jgi:hypothetical protein
VELAPEQTRVTNLAFDHLGEHDDHATSSAEGVNFTRSRPDTGDDMGARLGHRGFLTHAVCALALAAVSAATSAGGALADAPVPAGYTVAATRSLSAGVDYTKLRRDAGAPLSVHVARIHPHAAVAVRPVLSGNRVNGALERTSEMCRRVECLIAVNGDFHHLDTHQPVGGLVAGGVMVRSPVSTHHQLSFADDNSMAAGTFEWSARLMASDLRDVTISAVNVPRPADALVLYTPPFGPTTATNPHGAEMTIKVVEPTGPVRIGQTSLVEIVDFQPATGNRAIPADGAILSGHGAGEVALADLWGRVENGTAGRRALLRLEAPTGIVDSIGGSPVLVRDGRRFVGNDGSSFVAGRHPRTLVGWTATGEVLMVTVDGRQPGASVGISLPDAADLLISLGAVEAINLDGGGSTTFVAAGEVMNRPSDRLVRRGDRSTIAHVTGQGDRLVGWVERPVSVALAVVPLRAESDETPDPLASGAALPSAAPPSGRGRAELALPVPGGDPGSDPGGTLPAIVAHAPAPPSRPDVWPVALVAATLLGGVAVGVPIAPGRRRRQRLRTPRHTASRPHR